MKKVFATLFLTLLLPAVACAADSYQSNLKNQSDSKTGYYLVQEKTWSEGCVLTPAAGKHFVKPGQSATLKIKSGCTWGGVSYKIFKVANDEMMGSLSHSFRDGAFTMEVSAACSSSECVFRDLNPEQNRK